MANIFKAAIIFFILFSAALPAAAHAASFYFSPSYSSYTTGDVFVVSVFVSSTDQAMNAASGRISFPTDLLEVTSLSKSGSVLELWVAEPTLSNSAGTVQFEGVALNPGFSGATGKILTVTFRAKHEGSATLQFSSGSVLANDGQGTNILTEMRTSQYVLTDSIPAPVSAPSEAPAPSLLESGTSEGPVTSEQKTAPPEGETAPTTRETLVRVGLNVLFGFGVFAVAAVALISALIFVWYWYRFASFSYAFFKHAHLKVRKEFHGDVKKITGRAVPKEPVQATWRFGRIIQLLLLLVIFGLGGTYLLHEQKVVASALTTQELQYLAQSAVVQHEILIDQTRQLLSILVRLPQIRGNDADACNEALVAVIEGESRYINAGVILPDGRLWCSALPFEPPVYAGDRPYFKRTVASGGFASGDYQVGRVTNTPSINFGYPVRDENGALEAVAFVALDLTWLKDFASRSKLPPDSTIILVDSQGAVLARHPASGGGMGLEAPEVSYKLEQLLSVKEGVGIVEARDTDNQIYLLVAAPLFYQGEELIHIIISVPKQHITGVVKETFAGNALFSNLGF